MGRADGRPDGAANAEPRPRCHDRKTPSERVAWMLIALPLLAACGADTKPHPGYADPCTTPMSGVLSCPPAAINPQAGTMAEACRKLVACGVLAESYVSPSGTACSATEDCNKESRGPGGECLLNTSGNSVCHYHSLDYYWCMLRFTELGADPCDDQALRFTDLHVESAVECIEVNDCSVLGAGFSEKMARLQKGKGAENDQYICKKDGKTNKWTATICDGGLLSYATASTTP